MNVFYFYNQQYAINYMNWRPPTSQFGSLNTNRPPIMTNQNGDSFSWDYEGLGRLALATYNMNRPNCDEKIMKIYWLIQLKMKI